MQQSEAVQGRVYVQSCHCSRCIIRLDRQGAQAHHLAISCSLADAFALPGFLTISTVLGPSFSHMMCARRCSLSAALSAHICSSKGSPDQALQQAPVCRHADQGGHSNQAMV